jgi:hypothetical protein
LDLRSCTDDRDRHGAPLLREHPRDRHLAGGCAARFRDRVDRVRDRQVAVG